MLIDIEKTDAPEIYRLFTHAIIPRPIAWILSANANGSKNLAPFSYFNAVSSNPALLSVSIGRKKDGSPKDTLRNITERSHCVVHITRPSDAQPVMDSAKSFAYEESENEILNLETVAVENWSLPRLKGAPVAFYCKKYNIIEIGSGPQSLVLLEVTSMYINPEIGAELRPEQLNPLARLGGQSFANLDKSYEIHSSL